MSTTLIDASVFAELQETAGADFVAELTATFMEEAPGMLAELRSAQGSSAADRFRRAAHSLKTNAFTFGATVLGNQARELELSGVPASTEGIDLLEETYAASVAALQVMNHG